MKIKDKINKLTLVEILPSKIRSNGGKRQMGLFECECGDRGVKDISAVRRGHTKQCLSCARKTASQKRVTHGYVRHPLYRKWQDMKNRCYNPNVDRYHCYGGRGIIVCDEWKNDFKAYYDWCMNNGYKKELQVDRIDVDGNYEPSNCRYVTATEQGFNKRNTFYVIIEGEKYSLAKLMYENGLSHKYATVWSGIKKGRTIEYYIKKLNLSAKR